MPSPAFRSASVCVSLGLSLLACGSSSAKKKVPIPFDAGSEAGASDTGGTAGGGGAGGKGGAAPSGGAGVSSISGAGGTSAAGADAGGMTSGGTGAGGANAGGMSGTGGACAGQHSACVVGAALDPMCDPCASKLCNGGITYCCTHYWDLSCVEDAYTSCDGACTGGQVEAVGPLPPSNVKVKSMQIGFDAGCAIDENDQLWCWGDNTYGNLLDGDAVYPAWFPRKTDMTGVAEVAIWGSHICALDKTGNVSCWGGYMQTAPTQMLTNVKHLGGHGLASVCALKTDGTVWCWGGPVAGSGPAARGVETLTAPVQVALPDTATAVTVGEFVSCAIMSTGGTVQCWGVGAGSGNWNPAPPTTVLNCLPSVWNATAGNDCKAAIGGVTSLAVSAALSCVVGASGAVTCIGDDSSGQLDGKKTAGDMVRSPTLPAPATQVAVGDVSTADPTLDGPVSCALLTTGDVYCWGFDTAGSTGTAGLGNTNGVTVLPAKVTGLSNVVQLDYTRISNDGAALTQDGKMYVWGRDAANGRIGIGAMNRHGVPLTEVPFVVP